MTCAVCRREVLPGEHYFFQGLGFASRKLGQRPVREWTILAAIVPLTEHEHLDLIYPRLIPICR